MKRTTRLTSLILLLLLAAVAAIDINMPASSKAEGLRVTGTQSPDFTLVDTYGKSHKLSDYKGKWVVLEWLNHGCPFVRKHYNSGNMQRLQKKYTDQGVIWLSIVSSAPGKQGHSTPDEANTITAEKGAVPTAVLLDASGQVGKLYKARTTPHMFVINPEGLEAYQGAIDDRPTANQEDVEGATNYVDQALQQGMSGESVTVQLSQPYGCSVKY